MHKNVFKILFLGLFLVGCDSQQEDSSAQQPAEEAVVAEQAPATDTAAAEEAAPAEAADAADTAEAAAADTEAAAEPVEAEAAAPEAVPAAMSGEQVYQKSCVSCHGTGAANAPKFADKAAWEPRIAKGMDALYASAMNGVPGTAMMAKGTCGTCSEDEIKAAVDYMVSKAR